MFGPTARSEHVVSSQKESEFGGMEVMTELPGRVLISPMPVQRTSGISSSTAPCQGPKTTGSNITSMQHEIRMFLRSDRPSDIVSCQSVAKLTKNLITIKCTSLQTVPHCREATSQYVCSPQQKQTDSVRDARIFSRIERSGLPVRRPDLDLGAGGAKAVYTPSPKPPLKPPPPQHKYHMHGNALGHGMP